MDILDIAVTHLANDDYNHVPEDELRRRLAHVRSTRIETDLWESADRLIADVRDALRSPGDPEYGGGQAMTAPRGRTVASDQRAFDKHPAPVEVWIATLDTGGISHSGREFAAVDYSRENVEAAMAAAVMADGWPESCPIERDTPRGRIEALNDYYGIRVTGPIKIGTGLRADLLW